MQLNASFDSMQHVPLGASADGYLQIKPAQHSVAPHAPPAVFVHVIGTDEVIVVFEEKFDIVQPP